jgi:hypothetical protein
MKMLKVSLNKILYVVLANSKKTDSAHLRDSNYRKMNQFKISGLALVAIFSLGASAAATAGTWTPLTNQPTFLNPPGQCALYHNDLCTDPSLPSYPFSIGGMLSPLLMTDGSVLFSSYSVDDLGNVTLPEYKLTPDIYGSYQNGTWTRVADLPAGYGPLYFAEAVLPDGRIIYEGGEYNDPNEDETLTGLGAIYDPVANVWTPVAPPSFFVNGWPSNPRQARYPQLVRATPHPIGDSQSVVLADGRFMMADKLSKQAAILDPTTLTWTETGTATKNDWNSEEGWTLLPNGKVLTIDMYIDYWAGAISTYPSGAENSELYDPATGTWRSAGNTVSVLSAFPSGEIGASILRPDGTVFTVGERLSSTSGGHTSIYNSYTGQWTAGPDLPLNSIGKVQDASDSAAALLPNGNVLFVAKSQKGTEQHVYEFDGQHYLEQPQTPNGMLGIAGSVMMAVLPTGQVLVDDLQTDMELYNPAAHDHPWYAPIILTAPHIVAPGSSYTLKGILLNGMSQACGEGDDWQCASNFPLVRITNMKTKHVFYNRTHDFSSMAVANFKPVSTQFDVPANQEEGPSLLEVVTNGIASEPVHIEVNSHFKEKHGHSDSDNQDN